MNVNNSVLVATLFGNPAAIIDELLSTTCSRDYSARNENNNKDGMEVAVILKIAESGNSTLYYSK
jgi:hypothetical protein